MYPNEMAEKTKYAAMAGESVRETEVTGELRRLSETAHALQETAASLCSRLGSVQRISAPTPTGSDKPAPQLQLCPLASILRDAREMLERTGAMLDENRNMLEI